MELKQQTIHLLQTFQTHQNALPGRDAQLIMSPYGRERLEQNYTKTYRESAVLILIYPKQNQLFFVLIKRPSYNGVHSGQISLPGGGREDEDTDLMKTALRECQEEIDAHVEEHDVIGRLTVLNVPVSGYAISPFVAYSQSEYFFMPDKHEVEKILEIPLQELIDADAQMGKFPVRNGLQISAPFFLLNGQRVWGATAMILSEFKEMLN